MVSADARVEPSDGDLVVANVYGNGGKSAKTVIRLYKRPNFLVSGPADAQKLDVLYIDPNTASIHGVVVEMIRRRSPR